MMPRSINRKIVIVITATSILTIAVVMAFATYSFKRIVELKQYWIYTEKIETILDMLKRKHDLLQKTFMEDAYEEGFQKSFIDDFRDVYYDPNDNSETYPYIFSCDNYVIAHPHFKKGFVPNPQDTFLQQMIDMKEGSINYTYAGEQKWMIFRYFPDWDWIVGYTVSDDMKYASYRSFRNILFVIMLGTTCFSSIILIIVITHLNKPILTLTHASKALASGNLDYPVEGYTDDELGTLSETFMYMRDAIKEKMDALQTQNEKLEHEISERKRIADALADSESRYRLIVTNTNDLIIKFDIHNTLSFVSPSYCTLFNKTESELLGTSFMPLIHDDDRQNVADSINTMLEPPFSCYHEERTLTADGWQWLGWSNKGLCNESGAVTEIIAVGRIISERKKAEEEREDLIRDLEQKNEEMEAFTYSVSHDLKSPLITIIGFISFIQKNLRKKKYSEIPELADRIFKAATKMSQLLDDLLYLSRVGRVVKPPEAFSFKQLCYDVKELLSIRISQKKVSVHIADDLPDVYADRQRILEVVINLVENAIKFSATDENPEKPHITIGSKNGVTSQSVQHVLYIKDNGIGIDDAYKERIFKLFEKLDANSVGTGVGLALVKRIIDNHQGTIWVESEGKGTGCTFFFTLPAPPRT